MYQILNSPVVNRCVIWTAPAERLAASKYNGDGSGDGAFARTGGELDNKSLCPYESGVVLRFPPQSRKVPGLRAQPRYPGFDISHLSVAKSAGNIRL